MTKPQPTAERQRLEHLPGYTAKSPNQRRLALLAILAPWILLLAAFFIWLGVTRVTEVSLGDRDYDSGLDPKSAAVGQELKMVTNVKG